MAFSGRWDTAGRGTSGAASALAEFEIALAENRDDLAVSEICQ
jgi:hypothetical protein